MKELIKELNRKYGKIFVLTVTGITLILIGFVSWELYFVKARIFDKEEKLFIETAKRYFEYHKQQLPRKGEAKNLTLQDMYSKGLIDDLYIPKTKRTCDVNSRVRVYQNENGEYIYNSYLKCGNFSSKVDHLGPVITLNGESTITLAINSKYVDPGIKEVKDNKDGKIDVSKVKIDSSKVDMKKIGSYKVTYTISDSSFNKTVVERKVIVKANLTEIAKKDTSATGGYYVNDFEKNYLMYSGLLWRIVGINSDGSIKIITDDFISEVAYGAAGEEFKNSNIKLWLDNEFYPILKDTSSYVVEDATWCIDSTEDPNYVSDTCTNKIKNSVGLLTLSEYNKKLAIGRSGKYFLLTKANSDKVYTNSEGAQPINSLFAVRPVLVLKSNLFVTSGDGSSEKPYRLSDYTIGKTGDLLNTRFIGEYVNYSGALFRISGFDENKHIKLTSASVHVDPNSKYAIRTNYKGTYLFDPDDEESLGYLLNDTILDNIDESLMIQHEYTIYTLDTNKKYNKLKKKSSFKAKVSIPASFDLFSAKDVTGNYWLLDYVDDDYAYMVDYNGGIVTSDRTYADVNKNVRWAKIVIYLSNKAKIYNGNGTYSRPFHLR